MKILNCSEYYCREKGYNSVTVTALHSLINSADLDNLVGVAFAGEI